jgi:hypothetical protein
VAAGQAIGFTSFRAPSSSIGDDAMSANDPLGVTKSRHLHIKGTGFGLVIGGTPVTAEYIIHRAEASGTVRNFRALLNVDGSSTSITYDLKKNGTTILSGVVTLTHSTGDRTAVAGSISSAAYVAGDVFSIAQTVSSSTGATGPWADAEFDELSE